MIEYESGAMKCDKHQQKKTFKDYFLLQFFFLFFLTQTESVALNDWIWFGVFSCWHSFNPQRACD